MSAGGLVHLWGRLRALILSRSGKNLTAASIWQLSNYLIPLVTFPYLARVLGVEGFGLVGLGTAVIAYAILITDWGFDLTATQAVAQNQDDKVAINRIIWSVMTAKGALATLCAIAIVIGSEFYGPEALRPVLWANLSILVGNVFNVQWALRGVEALGSFVRASIIGRLAAVPLVFILVRTPADAAMAALTFGLGVVFMAILNQRTAFRLGLIRAPRTSLGEILDALKSSAHVFGASSAVSLYTNTITVTLGAIAGSAQVGLYSGGERIRRPVSSLLSPVSMVFFPRMNALLKSDGEGAKQLGQRLLLVQGGVSLVLALALLLFAPLLVRILLGEAFLDAVPILRVMAWMVFATGLSSVLGMMIMLPYGMKRRFTLCIASGAVVGLVLMFPLIYFYGAFGAALTALAAEVTVTLAMLVSLRGHFSWLRLLPGGRG